MSGLTNEECELLGDWWNDGSESDLDWNLSTLIPIVARIKRAAVNEALTEAADDHHCATCVCGGTECQDEVWCKRTWRHGGSHSVIRDEGF